MKIIIVGAGIAGLTLALACHNAGMEVKIYDKARSLRNIGGGILIWPHGLRYLKWLGLSHCLDSFYTPIKGCKIIGHQGNQIFSEDYAELYSLLGGEILPIDRSLLQNSLLAELPKHLLTLNKLCTEVDETENHARVQFADGTEDTADLVVGADGVFSTIRKNINPDVILDYTGYCWWGGIVDRRHVPQFSNNEVYIAMAERKLCIVWPTADDKLMWYLPCQMSFHQFSHENDGQTQLNSLCEYWHEDIRQLVSAPAAAQRFHLPIYAVPPQPHWTTQRTVLIGDAAHTLGPVLGQGASQAIEDVFVLFQSLKHFSRNIPNMLKRYEALRRPRYERLCQLENQSAKMMICESLDALKEFESQIPQLDLVTVYQDIIAMVNEKTCLNLAAEVLPIAV